MSRVRLAVLRTHDFFAKADSFAKQYPRYQKDGRTDVMHILGAAALEGFSEINGGNLAACFAALDRRAQARAVIEAALKEAGQQELFARG